MPIIDYHCHLNPQMVADDYRFKSLTEIWLGGDHYKWRAMRSNGVDECFCTGKETSDWEKFEKWAETVPYTFRNPLYHWTHLELKTAFGIRLFLCDCFQQCISSKPLNQHARNAHTEILHCQKEITAQCPFKGRTDNLIGEDYTQQCQ